ncbi:ABC transporter ATP-binding protein [Ilumatobacter coccineus]|uniref:Putative ABC transporter permease/ATP-binding protein n=1 Tax=Ilumatobacter coccineus (strain NBRC 103263 / KCTC 29153 / YM16-304) TaxID=1313172 RepID=A0A6C7E7R5_ILUCY|nr:ABC transporter ATP-binding protein [Ilumatobacter coccineus]BAN02777.1 putative ABC transporter permease/ATP-binding protein [Ilumatobacter coccineus YM16-304]
MTFATNDTYTATATIRRGLREAAVLRHGLWLTVVFAAIGALGRVVVPILIQQAIDNGIVDQPEVRIDFVAKLSAIGVVAVLISGIAFRQASIRLGERSERALFDFRERLIGHIHQLSLADHGEERRGGLVARVTSDIETLAQFFQWGGMAWLRSTTLMVIVAVVMLVYDWQLAMVAFAIALPLALVLRAVQKRLIEAHGAARERNGEMLGALAEVVSGAATIRAYGAGEHVAETVSDATREKARAQVRAALIGAFLFPSGEVFSVFTVSAVVGVGVWRGPGDGLTAGALIGFVFLTYRFLEPIAEFTEIIDQTQTAVAGLRRILTVLDMPVGPPEASSTTPLPSGPMEIEIDDVTFAYAARDADGRVDGEAAPDVPVLRNVTLTIPAGQQVAMVGETGSGKSTLGKLIARFADPGSGAIRVGGVDLTDTSRAELRSRLIVVSQEPFLFDDTIAANVAFARADATRDHVEQIVADLDVGEWVAALDGGLDTRVGERGEQLSAGERQLVALLRAGLADPDVLILDEATSSVDALTEVTIARALERLASTRTTIAIAHRLSTAARADRVLVLADGVLVEDGVHADLVAAGGTYSDLYDAWVSATSV